MIRVGLRGITQRRLRTVLTALAIVLGVAMVSGAYTLTDTMRGAADSLSSSAYDGTAAVVSAKTAFKVDEDFPVRPPVSERMLDQVRAVPGVDKAVGSISDEARIVDRDGDVVGTGPYFGVGLDPKSGDLSPFRLKEGRFATGPGQVVIDAGTADREHYAVGDTITVQARGPEQKVRVSGIATFGDVDAIGKATFALFDLKVAQTLFDKPGRYTEILVGGPDSVRAQLKDSLPQSVQVQTAAANDRFSLDSLKTFVKFLKVFLLVFGGIAVFVGAFTIYNTLSITVAQRSRELALMRALGATRRQVLRSVVVEALAIGTVASAIGLVAGIGLAKLISGVFASAGVELPSTSTVFGARTIIVSLAVGIIVTVLAGLGPALRATRVSPVTAMREGADIPAGRIGRRAPLFAAITGALSLGVLGLGLFGPGIDAEGRLALLAPGALLLFIAVALISPRLVPKLADEYGERAHEIVRKKPYELTSFFGVGFAIADTIARAAGIPPESPGRRRAAVVHVLIEAERDGSTCLPVPELAAKAGQLLNQPAPEARLFQDMAEHREIVLEQDDATIWAEDRIAMNGLNKAPAEASDETRARRTGKWRSAVSTDRSRQPSAIAASSSRARHDLDQGVRAHGELSAERAFLGGDQHQ